MKRCNETMFRYVTRGAREMTCWPHLRSMSPSTSEAITLAGSRGLASRQSSCSWTVKKYVEASLAGLLPVASAATQPSAETARSSSITSPTAIKVIYERREGLEVLIC